MAGWIEMVGEIDVWIDGWKWRWTHGYANINEDGCIKWRWTHGYANINEDGCIGLEIE